MTHFEGMEDRNNRGTASVSYTIRATAPQILTAGNKLFGSPDAAASAVDIPLYNPAILPPHPAQHKHLSHEATIRTMRLQPNHQTNTKLSFRDNMRSVFKKNSLPWLALGITFQAPDTVFLDRPPSTPLPVTINIRHLASGIGNTIGPPPLPHHNHRDILILSTLPPSITTTATPPTQPTSQPPQIHLKRLTLSLLSHTALRGGDDRFSGFGPKRFEARSPAMPFFKYSCPNSPNAALQIKVPVSDGAWLDLGTVLGVTVGHLWSSAGEAKGGGGGMGGGGALTGDFLTPNIMRRWGMEWELKLECVSEEVCWWSEFVEGGGLGVRLLRGDGAGKGE